MCPTLSYEKVSVSDCHFLQDLVRRAGACIMSHRLEDQIMPKDKEDGSPVTDADLGSQAIIVKGLEELDSSIPIISEENDASDLLCKGGAFWMVDPLDGTRDFIQGGSEFSVNIGLVVDGRPSLGVIYAPAHDDLFYRDTCRSIWTTSGMERPFPVHQNAEAAPKLLINHADERRLPVTEWKANGLISGHRCCSSAYKFGLLASGQADIYPRLTPSCEWDTAAGHALLILGGGDISVSPTAQLRYGKPTFLNPTFVAHREALSRYGTLQPFFDALS